MLVTYFHLFRFQQVLGLETEIRMKSLDLESLIGGTAIIETMGRLELPSTFSPRYPGYDSRGSSYRRRGPLIRETSLSHDDDQWHPYKIYFFTRCEQISLCTRAI
ncbi:hypothetical protein HanOQP8_Chr02g0049871 [Helianthus annuus]|nr:hypothetical protein HanOQP8_Chr02g0049871 [Helianthus annuus]